MYGVEIMLHIFSISAPDKNQVISYSTTLSPVFTGQEAGWGPELS
jgi:hypothetical protein